MQRYATLLIESGEAVMPDLSHGIPRVRRENGLPVVVRVVVEPTATTSVWFALEAVSYYLVVPVEVGKPPRECWLEPRVRFSLRVLGLDPARVSGALGLESRPPTKRWPKVWSHRILNWTEGASLDELLEEARRLLVPRLEVLTELSEEADVELLIGYEASADWMGGLHFPVEFLRLLALAGVRLDIDLYAETPSINEAIPRRDKELASIDLGVTTKQGVGDTSGGVGELGDFRITGRAAASIAEMAAVLQLLETKHRLKEVLCWTTSDKPPARLMLHERGSLRSISEIVDLDSDQWTDVAALFEVIGGRSPLRLTVFRTDKGDVRVDGFVPTADWSEHVGRLRVLRSLSDFLLDAAQALLADVLSVGWEYDESSVGPARITPPEAFLVLDSRHVALHNHELAAFPSTSTKGAHQSLWLLDDSGTPSSLASREAAIRILADLPSRPLEPPN